MKNLPILRNDSSFAVQISISVSKTRAMLLFKIKIKLIEMLELNERMPGMRSAEYQATIPLKFFHNYTILCKCLDNQPIKITPRFSGSEWRHWTASTAGRFRCCWEEKTTRSNRMNFRLPMVPLWNDVWVTSTESGYCFCCLEQISHTARPIRSKCYPDLSSDVLSVWNFFACSSDMILRGNQLWRRKMSTVYSG